MSTWDVNFQLKRSKFKVTGRQKHQESAAYLAYHGRPPIKRRRFRSRMQTRPNPLLGLICCQDAWQLNGRPHIMSALGSDMFSCLTVFSCSVVQNATYRERHEMCLCSVRLWRQVGWMLLRRGAVPENWSRRSLYQLSLRHVRCSLWVVPWVVPQVPRHWRLRLLRLSRRRSICPQFSVVVEIRVKSWINVAKATFRFNSMFWLSFTELSDVFSELSAPRKIFSCAPFLLCSLTDVFFSVLST